MLWRLRSMPRSERTVEHLIGSERLADTVCED